jgi:hypothetical protein
MCLICKSQRWHFETNFFSFVILSRQVIPLIEKVTGHYVYIGSHCKSALTAACFAWFWS